MGKNNKGKTRNKNFTATEIRVLAGFVKDNSQKLYGRAGHCSQKVEARKKRCWIRAVEALRVAGGPQTREWADVRKKWNELKVQANKYSLKKSGTGGGSIPATNDPLEQVLDAMAPQSKSGIQGQDTETDPFSGGNNNEDLESQECASSQENSSSQESGSRYSILQQQQQQPCSSNSNINTISNNSNNNNIKGKSISIKDKNINVGQHSINNIQPVQQQRATPKAARIRSCEVEEELLEVERVKLDLMKQSIEIQRGILGCLQSLSTSTLFNSMQ